MSRLGVLIVTVLVPFVTAPADLELSPDTPSESQRLFALGYETVTLVDQTRGTPAWNSQPAVSTRTIETLVVYPARGEADTSGAGAPPARGGPFPVVVFLHGASTTAEDYRVALERWAATGYVVVAPTAPLGGLGMQQSGAARNADVANHPADVRFVLDELPDAIEPAVSRVTNFDRVVVVGKSLGATTALAVAFDPCCTDDALRAIVPIAGPQSSLVTADNRVRTLVVHSESDEHFPYAAARANFDAAPVPKFLLTLHSATHAQTLSVELNSGADAAVIATTIDFFDRYLKSDDSAVRRMRRHGNAEGVATLERVTR